jgi:hypothetical protein
MPAIASRCFVFQVIASADHHEAGQVLFHRHQVVNFPLFASWGRVPTQKMQAVAH